MARTIRRQAAMLKRLTIYTLAVMAALATAFLLYEFRNILLLLFLAIFLSATIRPAFQFLIERTGLSRSTAVISVYLAGLPILAAVIILPGGDMVAESQAILNDIAATYESRFPDWMEGNSIERALASELPPPDDFYQWLIGPVFGQQVMGFTRGLLAVFGGAAVVVVLSVYWTIDQARLERYWLSLLPTDWRVEARRIWREVEAGVGAYLRSEIFQSVTAVILLNLVYLLMGVQLPLMMAVLAAIAWLIPLVGAFLAVLPLIALGLFNGSLGLSLVAALATAAILSGLELLVEPRLFNRRKYNMTLTVILMLILLEDYGLIGLIVAPPIAAALHILVTHIVKNLSTTQARRPKTDINHFQERLDKVLALQQTSGEPVSPAVQSLTKRLSTILEDAADLPPDQLNTHAT